jgi:hypothetical protein
MREERARLAAVRKLTRRDLRLLHGRARKVPMRRTHARPIEGQATGRSEWKRVMRWDLATAEEGARRTRPDDWSARNSHSILGIQRADSSVQ